MLLWNTARCAFGFNSVPVSASHMFEVWLKNFKMKNLVTVGIADYVGDLEDSK